MTFSTSLQNVASKVINKFGGNITFRRITTGTYNATTGTAAETNTDTSIKGVLDDVNKREVDDLVQAGDKKLIIAAKDLGNTVPTVADKIVVSSRVLQIIRILTIEQDNQPIAYEVFVRD